VTRLPIRRVGRGDPACASSESSELNEQRRAWRWRSLSGARRPASAGRPARVRALWSESEFLLDSAASIDRLIALLRRSVPGSPLETRPRAAKSDEIPSAGRFHFPRARR